MPWSSSPASPRIGRAIPDMRALAIAPLVLGLSTPLALADNHRRYSDGTTTYAMACNDSGYVLKSEDRSKTLYLGRSCDAQDEQGSEGAWCWANGGFAVELGGDTYSFGRQELFCDAEENPTTTECRCP